MALPASGPISMSMVNTELGISATTVITLNDAAVRTLFGKSSGAISLSDGYGKSNVVVAPYWGLTDLRNNGSNTYFANTAVPSNDREVTTICDINLVSGASPWSGGGEIQYHWMGGVPTTVNWQFHPGMIYFNPATNTCLPKTVNAATAPASFGSGRLSFYLGPSIYGPAQNPQVFNSATILTFNGSSDDLRSVGMWRVEVSNSGGGIMTQWINVQFHWDESSYECNCGCDCDENNENCTGCCSSCVTYQGNASDPGNLNNCGP